MRRWVSASLSLLLLAGAGCTATPAPPSCAAAGAEDRYFPDGLFAPDSPDREDFFRDWFGKHLAAMDEPSLSCVRQGEETYRFLWLRSFRHPIAVRITQVGDELRLDAVELSGAGGYEPGVPLRRSERWLTPEERVAVRTALARSNFWALPQDTRDSGLDGARWIVEGRRDGSYHLVMRWSPDEGSYRELGLLLVRLAGFSIPPRELY